MVFRKIRGYGHFCFRYCLFGIWWFAVLDQSIFYFTYYFRVYAPIGKFQFALVSDARYDSYKSGLENRQQESRLLTYLMENYDREVRPVYNASDQVVVKVGITLTQIFDMVSISPVNILSSLPYHINSVQCLYRVSQ